MAANILLGGVPEVFHFDSRLHDILIRSGGLLEQAQDLDFRHLQGMNMRVWLIFNIQGNFPLRGIKDKSGLLDLKQVWTRETQSELCQMDYISVCLSILILVQPTLQRIA